MRHGAAPEIRTHSFEIIKLIRDPSESKEKYFAEVYVF
jgi:hypothetical protein